LAGLGLVVVAFEQPDENHPELASPLVGVRSVGAENITPASEEQDRSSMADFVGLLQDEGQGDASGQQ
jgi:hypothetical protein